MSVINENCDSSVHASAVMSMLFLDCCSAMDANEVAPKGFGPSIFHSESPILRTVNCLVTTGPTYEPLDEVRRLTNFSTGRLGTELANFLTARGHSVTLLIGEQATWSGQRQATCVKVFKTTEDLRSRLQALASPNVDAVFHAAAVSDFRFGKVWQRTADDGLSEVKAGKIPTRLKSLLVELLPTEKIIHNLRDWFPKACLVGWKYEIDGGREALVAKALQQILESQTDACVANGRAYGLGFGVVTGDGLCAHSKDAESLFAALEDLTRSKITRRPTSGSAETAPS